MLMLCNRTKWQFYNILTYLILLDLLLVKVFFKKNCISQKKIVPSRSNLCA